MAAVSFNFIGKRYTKIAKPANTTAVELYVSPSGGKGSTLLGVAISAGGTGAAASVIINDGSTDWYLLNGKAVTANTTEIYDFGTPILDPGYKLKVVDGTGNLLTFTATFGEIVSR